MRVILTKSPFNVSPPFPINRALFLFIVAGFFLFIVAAFPQKSCHRLLPIHRLLLVRRRLLIVRGICICICCFLTHPAFIRFYFHPNRVHLHLLLLLNPSSLHPEIGMAMNCIKSLRNLPLAKEVTRGLGSCRTFAVGGKAKKGKGGGASDAPKQSTLSKEVKATTVVGANILKEGSDPKILPDSEYPDWLWHMLDKKPALSELRRKNIETLPYEDLKRFVKLDNRARIKENNSIRAKN